MEYLINLTNLVLLAVNIFLGILNVRMFFENRRHGRVDTARQIELKKIEIEEDQRKYKRDREQLVNDLGGWVIEREGMPRSERFPSYEDQQRMEDFDMEHFTNQRRLHTELLHLDLVTGDVSLLGQSKWKRIKFATKSLFNELLP